MENKVRYNTYNNLELCGILNKVNDTKEIVIICHARTSSKDSNATTSLANELTRNNINNFRFDFVSCGESDGDYTEYTVSNMIKNLEDTIKYLQSDFNSFILVGCSMGGRIVSLIDNPSIKKLVLWYPALDYKRGLLNLPSKNEKIAKKQGFCIMEKGVKFSYEYFKDERSYIPYKVLYKKEIPVLFVHGTNDPYVP
jgi:pimeloyl-ACP methyl ester carboxylesterase